MERSESTIQQRRIKIVKRLTCPRLYSEKAGTTTLDLERCRACRHHESDDGSSVKCGFPYKS